MLRGIIRRVRDRICGPKTNPNQHLTFYASVVFEDSTSIETSSGTLTLVGDRYHGYQYVQMGEVSGPPPLSEKKVASIRLAVFGFPPMDGIIYTKQKIVEEADRWLSPEGRVVIDNVVLKVGMPRLKDAEATLAVEDEIMLGGVDHG